MLFRIAYLVKWRVYFSRKWSKTIRQFINPCRTSIIPKCQVCLFVWMKDKKLLTSVSSVNTKPKSETNWKLSIPFLCKCFAWFTSAFYQLSRSFVWLLALKMFNCIVNKSPLSLNVSTSTTSLPCKYEIKENSRLYIISAFYISVTVVIISESLESALSLCWKQALLLSAPSV